jgi:hypothetical protein
MAKRAFQPDRYIQIDVKRIEGPFVICGMYTGVLYVEISMKTSDYQDLIRKGFFIRDGKTTDSAGILNTTETYTLTE